MNEYYDSTGGAMYAANSGGGALAVNNQMDGGFSLAPAMSGQMMNTRVNRQVARQASTAALVNQCQYGLTGMSIQHTVTLSALADQAAAFSPASEPHVRGLVDSYVNSAQNVLSGWYR